MLIIEIVGVFFSHRIVKNMTNFQLLYLSISYKQFSENSFTHSISGNNSQGCNSTVKTFIMYQRIKIKLLLNKLI